MYTVSVTEPFNATHRVRLPNGDLEPLHGHDWQITATFQGKDLDANGMVIDFIVVQQALRDILGRWNHANLNDHADFADIPTTAENVARRVFELLAARGSDTLVRVCVVEAPGCVASYENT